MEKLARILLPSFLLAAIFVALVRFEPFSGPNPATDSFLFEVQLEASADGPALLFFDRGDGFRALDAFSTPVKGGARQTCRFLVPPGWHQAFRLEALAPGEMTVFTARLADLEGHEVARFSPAEFRALQPQDKVEQRADGAHLRTGDRAGAVLLFAQPLVLRPPFDRAQAVTQFGLVALLTALLLWKFGRFFVERREKLAEALRPLAAHARAHPAPTLFVTAVLAVLVCCHPVIFFGKSFVSPNNRALCLYDDFPTLPGAPAGPIEDPKGSDIGAMLWSHLPYSMLEDQAIFCDHELPLRNRFNYCGVPLLGQGQSMIGDPLHWIAILADGASWAWDLKFVLAKVLFAFGVGLVVSAAVGRLGVAAALAASSVFIGFFSYRFNHAAFFSLSYAPWILFAWLKIARAPDWRQAARWVALLIAANWIELNSGTAKEASVLMLGLNFAGALTVLLAPESAGVRARKLGVAAAGLLGFLLVSAPCWLIFLDALRHAYTTYNVPRAYQIQPGLFLGLFDDLFYRQTTKAEVHTNPSANFFVLLGFVWALAGARRLAANRVFLALALAALPAFAVAFGVVSPAFIVRLPFLGNISHVDNTVSCLLIVLLFPLAGFGLQACRERMSEASWRGDWIVTLFIAGAFAAAFFGYTQVATRSPLALISESGPLPKSPFFISYATALFIAFAILPLAARGLVQGRAGMLANVLLAAVCMFALHFRQGMYLETKFDTYVMNPQDRIDLRAPSPAVEYVKAHLPEPGRVTGFGGVLTPGFNAVLGLESMAGTDPLLSPYLYELTHAARLQFVWEWRLVVNKPNTEILLPFYDLFNVRYYLGTVGALPGAVRGLKLIGSRDLDVYESPTVWPRAFFTDTIAHYGSAEDFAKMVHGGDRRPLAAVQESDRIAAPLPAGLAARRVVPASDYRLTGNTTTFTIDAPSAGVAVLSETFEEGNFRVTVNGTPAPYFRVNHVFNGVLLPRAGRFTIAFSYWPRLLTPALWLSAAGLVLLLAATVLLWRTAAPREEKSAP